MVGLIQILIPVIIFLTALMLIGAAASVLIPLLLLAIPLAYFVSLKHPNYSLWKNIKGLRTPKNWIPLLFLMVCSFVIAYALSTTYREMIELSGGRNMLGNLTMLTGMVIILGGTYWLFNEVNEGRIMNGIFEMMQSDNASALSDYLTKRENGPKSSLPGIDIDAQKLIAGVKKRVIGQDEIVDQVGVNLAEKASWKMDDKPLGVLMFVGPTGTGKTELANAIADEGFEGRIAVFPMNGFSKPESVSTLFGSPKGYLGSETGGELYNKITQLQSGVLLFDEIEKAHPDNFINLMKLLDDATTFDVGLGKWANATRFVIIFTSNAEQETLTKLSQQIKDRDQLTTQIRKTLEPVFQKPEILARIQDYYVFKKLEPKSLVHIIAKMIGGKAKKANVEVADFDSSAVINILERQEKQSEYGMRVLNNMLDRDIIPGLYRAARDGFKKVRIGIEFGGENGEDKLTVTGIPDESIQSTQSIKMESRNANS